LLVQKTLPKITKVFFQDFEMEIFQKGELSQFCFQGRKESFKIWNLVIFLQLALIMANSKTNLKYGNFAPFFPKKSFSLNFRHLLKNLKGGYCVVCH
jgi:hypothetical protein